MHNCLVILFIFPQKICNFSGITNPTKLIETKYSDLSYSPNGMPRGGILLSMIDTKTICPNYKWKSDNCLKDVYDCGDLLDISDINNLLTRVRKGAGTNCYSLDTTYFRSDLPNYVFGPYEGLDMTIGIILDLQKLWDYVACMFPIDSGSIARYNCTCKNENKCNDTNCTNKYGLCNPTINPEWIGKGEKGWNKYLHKPSSRDLAMAGCGRTGLSGQCGLQTPASEWILHNQDEASEHTRNVLNTLTSESIIRSDWASTNFNRPYSKYNWKSWVELTKSLYKLADNKKFTNLQAHHDDGYRENEVDIIIPNKNRDPKDPCRVLEEFKKVWMDCVLGVFTNAKTNCSNVKTIASDTTYGCNSPNCCCGEDLSIQIVKKLVSNFNKKLPTNKKPIEGYTLNTINIVNFETTNGINHLGLKSL